MTYVDAKKLKVGDWVGYRKVGNEDGIVIAIHQVVSKNELILDVMFETHGIISIKHKDLNPRALAYIGKYDFYEALRCPSVMNHGLTKTSNEDLFKLWGVKNPFVTN